MMSYAAGTYLLKVNNKNTRTSCETCSKLTMETLERRHWHHSGITPCSSVSIVNVKHVVAGWVLVKFGDICGVYILTVLTRVLKYQIVSGLL